MPTLKLTKYAIEAQPCQAKDVMLHDTEVKGFQCKMTPKGKRVYQIYYRTTAGNERRQKIGVHGEITLQQARERAKDIKAAVQQGEDPSGTLQATKLAPSIVDLCNRYLSEHAIVHKKKVCAKDDESMIRNYIVPKIGNYKTGSVKQADVAHIHSSLKNRPYRANRVISLLSKMFNLAEQWGLREPGTNPTRFVQKFKEQSRQRFLSQSELEALSTELLQCESLGIEKAQVIDAIRLLLLTGCRRDEIRTLRFKYVDWDRGQLVLPNTKTGQSVRQLGGRAIEYLATIRERSNCDWVIPSDVSSEKPWSDLQKAWRRIRKRCDLNDVRLHDLRHTHAASAAGLGTSLPVIGKLLGHTQASTTQIYAHVADDPLRDAADQVSSHIASKLFGET
ncbi:MAG: site-specific integrase [Alphaproteobacteria bacterium]|jgi:integrase|nr:site-specific integrase [Alphaproteobacteria bacterium]MBT4082992.1 site-specific integrase [Alphaproteobacteria bacterium]